MDGCDKDGRTDLDVARYLTTTLSHASMKAKFDWDAIFDEERVVAFDHG